MRHTPHDPVDQPTGHRSTACAENYLRTSGATLVAAGAVIGAPFIVFTLIYKTYNLVRLGHWYTWGPRRPSVSSTASCPTPSWPCSCSEAGCSSAPRCCEPSFDVARAI